MAEDEEMVVVPRGNSSDAIRCLVKAAEEIAAENRSTVSIQILHGANCGIMGKQHPTDQAIGEHPSAEGCQFCSGKPRGPLSVHACDCDPEFEAVFRKGDEESLLVWFLLSEVTEDHSWLKDEEVTALLLGTKAKGHDSLLVQALRPAFKRRLGVFGMDMVGQHQSWET